MTAKPPRIAPVSVRLAPEERARGKAEADAHGLSEHAYYHWRIVHHGEPMPRRRRSRPKVDHVLLSALLAKLGQSRIANNLNQLAKAANSGSLVLEPDIEADLRECLAAIDEMRLQLVEALGLSESAS